MTGNDWPWEREKSRLVSSESEGNRVWGGQILLPCSKNIPNKLKFKIIKTNFRGQKKGQSEEFVKAEQEKFPGVYPKKTSAGAGEGGRYSLREKGRKSLLSSPAGD